MYKSCTLAIIKPEAVAYPYIAKTILNEIVESGLKIVGAKKIRMTNDLAKRLYDIHKEKFFYQRLIQHVTSGPVIVMELGCTEGSAVERWRTLMGPSKMMRTLQAVNRETLRARFALSDTRNLVHGADSEQTASAELELFAPYPPVKELDHLLCAEGQLRSDCGIPS